MNVLAVCGVKNSGKTTLLTGITRFLSARGLKVAVIKHDGHDFEPDRPGTDSFRHKQAGAYGTVVFSSGCFSLVKDTEKQMEDQTLFSFFPEADLILLEGFKHTSYPKIEIVRKEISQAPVSCAQGLKAIVTDLPSSFLPLSCSHLPIFSPEDIPGICQLILTLMESHSLEIHGKASGNH